MEQFYTLYEWCLRINIRPLKLKVSEMDDFMLKEIPSSEMNIFTKDTSNYKEKSTPRKPDKFLERRMYGLVPYNISREQKGIQFDHAKDEYYKKYFNDKECVWFRNEWMTTMMMNGGTSNEGRTVRHGFKDILYLGTMEQHLDNLMTNKVKVGYFNEPDLNNMLSGIVFLVDERVFDKELYPNFVETPLPNDVVLTEIVMNKWEYQNKKQYNKWLEKIGGPQNEFLRTFLADKRFA